jgi:hypothetical protein
VDAVISIFYFYFLHADGRDLGHFLPALSWWWAEYFRGGGNEIGANLTQLVWIDVKTSSLCLYPHHYLIIKRYKHSSAASYGGLGAGPLEIESKHCVPLLCLWRGNHTKCRAEHSRADWMNAGFGSSVPSNVLTGVAR